MLQRLSLPFTAVAPEVEEDHLPNESGLDRAIRLAELKAKAVAEKFPDDIVIGSDQVALLGNRVLDKPGTQENAIAQLTAASGQAAQFHTAVCVSHLAQNQHIAFVDTTKVQFRDLSQGEIAAYLQAEPALDCAGSCKVEGLGISLLEKVQNDDPTALVGLPLIKTAAALRQLGLNIPG